MVESGREWFEVVANDHRNGKSRGTSCRTKAGDCVMFMGEYNHTVDPKGRLIVPAKFREQLGDEFVVTKGLDGCLFVYTSEAVSYTHLDVYKRQGKDKFFSIKRFNSSDSWK